MLKTSINLTTGDIQFANSKGSNLSEGIRYCINYCRDAEIFKGELKAILKDTHVEPREHSINQELKDKILSLMEED